MKSFRAHFFAVILTLSMISLTQAQNFPVQKCGHDLLLHQNEALHPGYIDAVNQSFDFIKSNSSQHKSSSNYEIRTVIHVVHANDEQNIDDGMIRAVMDVVNDDFSGLSSVERGLRPIFHSIVGNSGIEFTIEEIIRHRTDTMFAVDFFTGSLPDNVKLSAYGGSDAMDTDQFLNIWICDIQFEFGTLLGYAYPPLCAPNWPDGSSAPMPELDGVVMDYLAVDTMSIIQDFGATIQVRGHALTHEIGHYLGLRHIWGDGSGVIFGTPDCTVDDGIEDTPNQGLPSQGSCDTLLNTCTDDVDDLPDMIENFMDYSDERCLNLFTTQQVEVMHATLESCRSNILITNQTEPTVKAELMRWGPNPNQGLLTLSNIDDTISKIEIFSSEGKQIQSLTALQSDLSIDLSIYQDGLYFIVARDSQSKVLSTQKVILHK